MIRRDGHPVCDGLSLARPGQFAYGDPGRHAPDVTISCRAQRLHGGRHSAESSLSLGATGGVRPSRGDLP
jgi:hypothetical protein